MVLLGVWGSALEHRSWAGWGIDSAVNHLVAPSLPACSGPDEECAQSTGVVWAVASMRPLA